MDHGPNLAVCIGLALTAGSLVSPAAAKSQIGARPPLVQGGFWPSLNDWGQTGLFQLPSARMAKDGAVWIGASRAWPYRRYYGTSQFLPWLQTTFRWTQVATRPRPSGGYYVDKALDLKVRLVEEGRYTPEVSLAFRDIIGTGLFSSEYLLASRRFYDFDFTAGLAWGNAATGSDLTNPLGLLSDALKRRPGVRWGQFGRHYFRGENMALVGGVEWHTPIDNLRFKAEVEANNYKNEPAQQPLKQNSPVNLGVAYHPFPWLNLQAAWERGNTALVNLTLRTNLNEDFGVPNTREPLSLSERAETEDTAKTEVESGGQPSVPWDTWTTDRSAGPGPRKAAGRFFKAVRGMGFRPDEVSLSKGTLVLNGRFDKPALPPKAARIALAILRRGPFGRIDRLVLRTNQDGREHAATFPREALERSVAVAGTPIALFAPGTYGWPARADGTSRRPPTPRSLPQARQHPRKVMEQAVADKVFEDLKKNDLTPYGFRLTEDTARLWYGNPTYPKPARAAGRAARVLAHHTPESVARLELIQVANGVALTRLTVPRAAVVRHARGQATAAEVWQKATLTDGGPGLPGDKAVISSAYPNFGWGLRLKTRQSVGDPDQFLIWQARAQLEGEVNIAPGLSVQAKVAQDLYNNFEDLTHEPDSALPHVRTDIVRYFKDTKTWLEALSLNYIEDLGPALYGRLSAGIFERMYGGLGGEVLYRPMNKRWAIGLDVNHVWKRDFNGRLAFRNYNVTTGHLTWYQDLPFYGLNMEVSAGRYLARDVGATLNLSRTFDNGVTVGGWATKTDVPAQKFGEGSFDKGLYVSIPLDLFTTGPTRQSVSFPVRPLTRDGGQKVGRPKPLYEVTGDADGGEWRDTWSSFGN